MTFGEKIKLIRKQLGLTQNQLSVLVCMEQCNLSKYENNKLEPTISIIKRFAQKLDKPLGFWLDDNEE
jgi:transcriptional regulator with XRE-family HTH domain